MLLVYRLSKQRISSHRSSHPLQWLFCSNLQYISSVVAAVARVFVV
jgi:hypothetical protein